MPQKHLDVIVVGAGPVGLFCANELIRHGLSCRLIDKKIELGDKSKALGIHIRTLDVLEDCGFLEEILKQGHQVIGALIKSKGMVLVDATFANIEANRHFLIDLPQDKTERILAAGAAAKQVDIEWQTELTAFVQTDEGVISTLTKSDGSIEQVSSSWLIACDGARSTARHLSALPFEGSEYKENWWLADLLIDWALPDNRMVFYVSQHGPMACFPMGDKRYRLVLTAPEGHDGDPQMADIQAVFNQRSSDHALLSNPLWITKFYIHHRQIKHYRNQRLFFAGDAAHIHSPMGGQGLNTGIQDIYNLVWKLALVEKGLAPESLLDSYHEERYPVGREVLNKTDKMTQMVVLRNPVAIAVRNACISMLMSIKWVKNKMISGLAELDISYQKSPIVKTIGDTPVLRAGYFLTNFDLFSRSELILLPFSGHTEEK